MNLIDLIQEKTIRAPLETTDRQGAISELVDDPSLRDQILAVLPGNNRRPPQGRQAARRTPTAPRFPLKSANCGSVDHVTSKCPKGNVDPKDRPCWKCGQTGHTSCWQIG